jgi:hypothetical protein
MRVIDSHVHFPADKIIDDGRGEPLPPNLPQTLDGKVPR